jgi:hypothetical protein
MDKVHDCYAQSRVFQKTTDIFKEHLSLEVLFPITKHSLHDAHRNYVSPTQRSHLSPPSYRRFSLLSAGRSLMKCDINVMTLNAASYVFNFLQVIKTLWTNL